VEQPADLDAAADEVSTRSVYVVDGQNQAPNGAGLGRQGLVRLGVGPAGA
jgi:hypothetical protein